jgi:hypothetical protein
MNKCSKHDIPEKSCTDEEEDWKFCDDRLVVHLDDLQLHANDDDYRDKAEITHEEQSVVFRDRCICE